jgi:hypothetical protein
VEEALGGRASPPRLEDAKLAVSEIVSSVRSDLPLVLSVDTDEGSGRVTLHGIPQGGSTRDLGPFLDVLADRWGLNDLEDGVDIWFEVPMSATTPRRGG